MGLNMALIVPAGRPSGLRAAVAAGLLAGAAFLTLFLSAARIAAAHENIVLLMVEEVGCRFCKKWDQDVGGVYPKTGQGRFAPLKRVKRGAPEIRGFNPVIYTPTFIVVRGGEEVGRITGYPGKPYFWSELGVMLSAIGYLPQL